MRMASMICRCKVLPLLFFFEWQSIAHSRIDRFLVAGGAGSWFCNLTQKALICFMSNHVPIIASSGDMSSGQRPFRLFNI